MKRKRRPPQVALYRNHVVGDRGEQKMMNFDLIKMTRLVRADDFNEFQRYARENAGWGDKQIRQTWEAVHGWGTAPELENVD